MYIIYNVFLSKEIHKTEQTSKLRLNE